jgi:hypothetical protein
MGGTPTLPEVLEEAITARLLDVHVGMPGKVVSYDAAKQVAEVQPMIRRVARTRAGDKVLEDLPKIPNVPIRWPRGGGYYLHFPLAAGDSVYLSFSEAAFALWRTTGQLSEPGDERRHSLAFVSAEPDIAPDDDRFTDAPSSGEGVIVVAPGGALRVSEPGAGGAAQPVMTVDAFMTVLTAACSAAGAAAVAVGAGGAGAAFTAFIGAFNSANPLGLSSSKLKAQFP